MNHYKWLEINFCKFLKSIGVDRAELYEGLITAHGDKAYGYQSEWEEKGISFNHGVAIYLLTHIHPWSKEVRETPNGWVSPDEWVIANYDNFKNHLPT